MQKSSVAMGVGFFNPDEAGFLEGFGHRAEQEKGKPASLSLEEVSIGIDSSDPAGSQMAIAYVLGSEVTDIADAVLRTTVLTDAESLLLSKFATAEVLFHWEDDLLSPADRGPAVPVYAAIVLDDDTAQRLSSLIATMVNEYKDGLIERARSVGYYRECMALARTPEGQPVYLLYLELKVTDYPTMVARLLEYPKTAFNAWWTPQYIELVGKQLVKAAVSATAYRWSAPR